MIFLCIMLGIVMGIGLSAAYRMLTAIRRTTRIQKEMMSLMKGESSGEESLAKMLDQLMNVNSQTQKESPKNK